MALENRKPEEREQTMNQIVFSDVGLLLQADALEGLRALPDACAQVCVTSPPYFGLRDYGVAGREAFYRH